MAEEQGWQSVEEMAMFARCERLCDAIWDEVNTWKPLAVDTVGKQLIRAADSIGANLVEGDGRYHHKEKLNFCYIARGSAKETCYWIRRTRTRKLITAERAEAFLQEIERIRIWINTLISHRRKWLSGVREERVDYVVAEIEIQSE
jgi:four helix bundle protein